MTNDAWRAAIEALRRDNTSGATEITARAAQALAETIAALPVETYADAPVTAARYRRWLLILGRQLIGAQPAMASLYRLANDLLWAVRELSDEAVPAELRERALAFVAQRQSEMTSAIQAAACCAATNLARYTVLLTHSRSAAVEMALLALAQRGLRPRVICGESRPMYEGCVLAETLARAGLPVTLMADMALFGALAQAQALVVGADAISPAGLVNKVGTATLARAAMERELPVIAVCISHKLLPWPRWSLQREGDPREIATDSPAGLSVANPYFDVTPLTFFDLVITEWGALPRLALYRALADVRRYPGLVYHGDTENTEGMGYRVSGLGLGV